MMDAINSLRQFFILTTVMLFVRSDECYEQFKTVFIPTTVLLFLRSDGCYKQFKTVFLSSQLQCYSLGVMDAMNSLRQFFIFTTVMSFLMNY